MIVLNNQELRIDLLDPVHDRARLGPRFCGGGLIWQIFDEFNRPLLSGPEWPTPAPSPFNGQGLPESFRHRTLDGQPLTWRGDRGVALGAGELRMGPDGQVALSMPCTWNIKRRASGIEFFNEETFAGYHYALTRRIDLAGREVRSYTRLANLSTNEPLVLEWFAHPFFPLVNGMVKAEIAATASLPDNPGFTLRAGMLTQNRRFTSVSDGHMDRGLQLPPGRPLVARLTHPFIAYVDFETSFVPSFCVIWGNDRTFSFEPYLTLNLAPGEIRDWSLTYSFGLSSGMATSGSTSRITLLR